MRFRLLCCVVLLARLATGQVPDTARRTAGATLSGVVRDSIARVPLARAVVQLVPADSLARSGRTAVSDSLGRFTIRDVLDGHYVLGFFHPMLDSLGVEPLLRGVHVEGARAVRADLAIPSPGRLRAAICGQRSADSGAVVVGIVRDSRDHAAAAGVTVVGEWLEFSFTPQQLTRHIPRRIATTSTNGWFALCNLPSVGAVAVMASRGADSTDFIEVQIPAEGFLRRELYLGSARTVVRGDATQRGDTLAPPPSRRRTGDGQLKGTVVAAVGGKALAGARVSIPDGPQTAANERGEWTLVGAPAGTRVLEVRAVGYYPERKVVDVIEGAAPIRTALFTMQAMLDTVRVTASRLSLHGSGFMERRRGGAGRFVAPEDIARRKPLVTSDLFMMVPGLAVDRDAVGETQIQMRGTFADKCSPAVYVDGHYMSDLSASAIDAWVSPDQVAGIEIYAGAAVPPQFSRGMAGVGLSEQVCGSIVIWTKLPTASINRTSWKVRIMAVLGLAALAVAIGALLDRR